MVRTDELDSEPERSTKVSLLKRDAILQVVAYQWRLDLSVPAAIFSRGERYYGHDQERMVNVGTNQNEVVQMPY